MWQDEFFDDIKKGDTVYYQTSQGKAHKAKAKFQVSAGWVCDGGTGQPVIINEGYNYLGHSDG
jgi:hypothetical protein